MMLAIQDKAIHPRNFSMLFSVVIGAEKRKEDRKKAGEVLSHFDGAEMFDLMCREHDEFSNQFYSLIKEYQDSKIIPRTL